MKKVLLASVSNAFLRRNTNLLQRREFQLYTATSGAVVVKMHEEYRFELILCDLALDDMDGCTLCSLVRNGDNHQHVPVILICHNMPDNIARVEQSGADAMLLKPIEPISLIETIGSFLGLEIGRSKRVVLEVKVLSKKSALEFFCFSHDISNTGILLETEHQLDLGSRIHCQFNLPDSCLIETEGEVVRMLNSAEDLHLYGVKFIGLAPSYRRAIETYVNLAER